MSKVTQAELARLYGVSRKTITKWKAQGRLVLSGEFVDLEETQARLAQSATSRTKRVTLPEAGKGKMLPVVVVGNVAGRMAVRATDGSEAGLTKDGPYSAGVTSGVSSLAEGLPEIVARAALAAGLPLDAARALDTALRPMLTARMSEVFDAWQIDPFVHLIDEEEHGPILAADTWAVHTWPADTFLEPLWAELEAAASKAWPRA